MGLPPTEKPIKFTGITILKFRDRKCIERWNEADFLNGKKSCNKGGGGSGSGNGT